MKIKTRGSGAALERYLKMAHYEGIPFKVDLEYSEDNMKSFWILTFDTDPATFQAAVDKYRYKDYIVIEE